MVLTICCKKHFMFFFFFLSRLQLNCCHGYYRFSLSQITDHCGAAFVIFQKNHFRCLRRCLSLSNFRLDFTIFSKVIAGLSSIRCLEQEPVGFACALPMRSMRKGGTRKLADNSADRRLSPRSALCSGQMPPARPLPIDS